MVSFLGFQHPPRHAADSRKIAMTAQKQFTHFSTVCKVEEIDGSFHLTGSFCVRADIAPVASELDQIIDLSDQVGQLVKQEIATVTIQEADRRAARLAQEVAPHCHKHGSRPFTIITPSGRLKVNRQRLIDTQTGKSFIPSAKLWNTAQNRHIVMALAKSACQTSQDISFRKSQKRLSADARTESLLAHSTVWNLKQAEEERLENAQQKFVKDVLQEHGKTLDKHGFLPPPPKSNSCDGVDEEFSEEIKERADELYTHFTSEHRKNKDENDSCDKKEDDVAPKRRPRHVPADTILLQADEDVTKSQEPGRKANKTFTATVETGTGRCEYLAARSSESLQTLVAAVLILLGLFSGKKLEVISDGAAWIGNWIGRLRGLEVYQFLCWYHLTKRVLVGLSGLGAPKEERKLLEREILGHLWKGNVTKAIEELKAILPRCRVPERVEELIDYLMRKRSWIADYESRHSAGLWIASTRVEKWNDVAISERCKHRGMSWTESGVLAMALHAAEVKRNIAQNAQIDPENHTSL
jgi:hypothetical protein